MLTIKEISDPIYKSTVAAWENNMPAWWKEADRAIAEYKMNGPLIAVGAFNGEDLAAVFYLQQIDSHTVEAHLSCPKGTNPLLIEHAGATLKQRLFQQGFAKILVQLPTLNRGLLKIVKAWGFTPTNVNITAGQFGNRPIRWVQLEALSNVE